MNIHLKTFSVGAMIIILMLAVICGGMYLIVNFHIGGGILAVICVAAVFIALSYIAGTKYMENK